MGKLGLNSGYIGSDQRTTTNGVVGYDKFYLERVNGRFNPVLDLIGLLDSYPGAAAAYSLRRLSGDYQGSAIRVRRSSDNTEQDIGFEGTGELSISAVLNFCGVGNGFVTTWYDQSGNSNNATQVSSTNQPQIVSNGDIIFSNTKPTLKFDGVNDFFSLSSNIVPNTDWSLFGLGAKNESNKPMGFLSNNLGNPNSSLIHWTDGKVYLLNNSSYISTNTTYTNLTLTLWSGFVISTTPQFIYRNNVLEGTSLTNTSIFQNFERIGVYAGTYSSANMTEIILYQSNQTNNRTGIESNINDFYSIY
jgi:hypothetical protein